MTHRQRSFAVFEWDGELPGPDLETDPERLTTLTARAPAGAILAALRSRGYRTDVESPYEGEGGWHFGVEIDGRAFGVFTLWTGISGPNSFAAQLGLRRGAFAAFPWAGSGRAIGTVVPRPGSGLRLAPARQGVAVALGRAVRRALLTRRLRRTGGRFRSLRTTR